MQLYTRRGDRVQIVLRVIFCFSPPPSPFSLPKNIWDMLVHSTLTSTTSGVSGNFQCDASRYKTCPTLQIMDTFASKTTDRQFATKIHASCKNSKVICLIEYRRCGLQYVGEIGQALHCRINEHCFDIVHGFTEESPVASHF